MDISTSLTLILLLVILVITPGPGMVTILATVVARGLPSGIALISGITTIHIAYVIIISVSFALVLDYILPLMPVIQMLGGCYLMFLGYKQYKGKRFDFKQGSAERLPFMQQYYLGILSSLSNPKIIVFYFSVLPNFIDLDLFVWRDGLLIVSIVGVAIWVQLSMVCITAGYLRHKILTPDNNHIINHIAGIILALVGLYLIAQMLISLL